jgi:hypothetical protein
MFTIEELKNLLALVNIAPIKGQEAVTVAMLQQKILGLLEPKTEVKETKDKK